MEETLELSISMPKSMVFLKKAARIILPKILNILAAQIFRNVKTALTPKELNLEIRVIVGPHLVIPYGRSTNTAECQGLIT